jgi:Mg2+-importing ATPase
MATQILVIFIIRTNSRPWRNRPHPALIASSLAALVLAVTLPFSGIGTWFGFAPPSWPIIAAITLVVCLYLAMAELMKRLANGSPRPIRPRPISRATI